MSKIEYKSYEELKERVRIIKSNEEKFRKQNEVENSCLRTLLLKDKEILSPLSLVFNEEDSTYVLADGHHRWQLLPQVIKECPEFILDIPVIFVDKEDVSTTMWNTQLGRRNLGLESVIDRIEELIREDGLSRNKAYSVVAEETGKSKSAVQLIHQPNLVEKQKKYYQEKLPEISNKSTSNNENSLPPISEMPILSFPLSTDDNLQKEDKEEMPTKNTSRIKGITDTVKGQISNSNIGKEVEELNKETFKETVAKKLEVEARRQLDCITSAYKYSETGVLPLYHTMFEYAPCPIQTAIGAALGEVLRYSHHKDRAAQCETLLSLFKIYETECILQNKEGVEEN